MAALSNESLTALYRAFRSYGRADIDVSVTGMGDDGAVLADASIVVEVRTSGDGRAKGRIFIGADESHLDVLGDDPSQDRRFTIELRDAATGYYWDGAILEDATKLAGMLTARVENLAEESRE